MARKTFEVALVTGDEKICQQLSFRKSSDFAVPVPEMVPLSIKEALPFAESDFKIRHCAEFSVVVPFTVRAWPALTVTVLPLLMVRSLHTAGEEGELLFMTTACFIVTLSVEAGVPLGVQMLSVQFPAWLLSFVHGLIVSVTPVRVVLKHPVEVFLASA